MIKVVKDRNIHLTTIAKQSIENAVEEAYRKRNETLAREGQPLLPPRSRNDWQHLGDSDFFKLIPPLLKVNIDVKKDSISDYLFKQHLTKTWFFGVFWFLIFKYSSRI